MHVLFLFQSCEFFLNLPNLLINTCSCFLIDLVWEWKNWLQGEWMIEENWRNSWRWSYFKGWWKVERKTRGEGPSQKQGAKSSKHAHSTQNLLGRARLLPGSLDLDIPRSSRASWWSAWRGQVVERLTRTRSILGRVRGPTSPDSFNDDGIWFWALRWFPFDLNCANWPQNYERKGPIWGPNSGSAQTHQLEVVHLEIGMSFTLRGNQLAWKANIQALSAHHAKWCG